MSSRFHALLEEQDYLIADGAMGTNLFKLGLETGDAPEIWNLERASLVKAVHEGFIAAGSDIVLTNSFGGSGFRLKLHKADHRVGELNRAAAALAREVAESAERPVLVAGSIGPSGELFEPIGPVTFDQGRDAFREQAEALAEGGADMLWIETMSAREEVAAAVAGARGFGLPIVVTMTFDTAGRTMMGVSPGDATRFIQALPTEIAAFGVNCGIGPAEAILSLTQMAEAAEGTPLLVAKANCGVPEFVGGEFQFTGTPTLMADYARLARDSGARIIGGCCGSSWLHLAALREALDSHVREAMPDPVSIAERLGRLSLALPISDDDTPSDDDIGRARRPRRRRRRKN